MITLDIKNIINSNFAISSSKGDLLFKELKKQLDKKNKITVDFKNIKSTITAFFNTSYGKLFENYEEKVLDENILFINTKPSTDQQIKEVKKAALKFYGKIESDSNGK